MPYVPGSFANMISVGQQLRSSLIKDWYYYYILYDELKAALKTSYEGEASSTGGQPKRRSWTEADEKHFVTQLEAELDKVFTFQRVKSGEIVRRIKASEREVNDVIRRLKETELGKNGLSEGSSEDRPTEGDFELLEEDVSEIIADVHDLAKFTQLNYTGFLKIIKKHDVSIRESLSMP
jgi:SPX domain protein involved in polyphosphate accumulation